MITSIDDCAHVWVNTFGAVQCLLCKAYPRNWYWPTRSQDDAADEGGATRDETPRQPASERRDR